MNIQARSRLLYLVLFTFLLLYFVFKIITAVGQSLFISRPSRLNMIFYGPATIFYSFDALDNQNYSIVFDPEVKLDVPGGYGQYRIGSLGKLVKLEQKPDIIQKTFSATTTSFVQYYFYQKSDDIYYDAADSTKKPTFTQLLFLSSNASFLDRLYLIVSFFNNSDDNVKIIRYRKEIVEGLDDTIFQEKTFIRDSIGLLYNNDYRREQQSIQILYQDTYKTAETISFLLEGNGIKVSDINKSDAIKDCRIIIGVDRTPQTARDLSKFFNCPIIKGKTSVYDILFTLGNREEEWKINN